MTAKKNKTDSFSILSWAPISAILVLTFFVFWQVKGFDFLSNWDDDGYVLTNADIQSVSWDNIKKLFSSSYKSNYQPISMISYMIEFSLFQLNVKDGQELFNQYHITNLLFHLLNTLLVYLFVKKLVKRTDVSVISAFFFALHPMHVESVAWISERKDVMYAAFFLWALIVYLNYLDKDEKKGQWYGLTLFLFILSVLSKSMAVTFPLILFALDYYKGRKINKNVILEKIPFFIISLVIGIIALKTQSGSAMDIVPEFSLINRFFITCYSVVFYIFKLFVPTGLASIHYYPDNSQALPWQFYSAPIVIILIGIILWKVKEFRKELIFGLSFFLLSISIVLQIIPVGHAFASERYSYVPYIGLVFIVAQLYAWTVDGKISFMTKYKSLLTGVLAIGGLIFCIMTYQRLGVWKDSLRLYSDTIEKYPNVAHARWMRANVKKDFGNSAILTNKEAGLNFYKQSIQDYDMAIKLDPQYSKAYFNRGGSKASLNLTKEALADYTKSIELDSSYAPAFNNRGNAYMSLKQYDLAIKDYEKCNELSPDYAIGYLGCGNAYQQIKKYQMAIDKYNRAIELNPVYSEAIHNRGVAHYYNNQKDKACEDWNLAKSLNYQQSIKIVDSYCK